MQNNKKILLFLMYLRKKREIVTRNRQTATKLAIVVQKVNLQPIYCAAFETESLLILLKTIIGFVVIKFYLILSLVDIFFT